MVANATSANALGELETQNKIQTTMLPVLHRAGIIGMHQPSPVFVPLEGGVSSDIWKVELPGQTVCLKRALEKLKVKADWRVSLRRNAFEAAYFEVAGRISPGCCPHLIHHDHQTGALVMTYLAPDRHHLWKDQLKSGDIDLETARNVGSVLGRVHRATALSAEMASRFNSQSIFQDIRIEPYLLALIDVHPQLARQLKKCADTTGRNRKALVHGDVSPKNIMIGPDGPVLLDAECAVYGDPAFDIAFCLNHLLLKRVLVPDGADKLMAAFENLVDAYMHYCVWEPRLDLEARAAALLPALNLARVDGKSPVEYITSEHDRSRIRFITQPLIEKPSASLMEVAARWHQGFGQ